MVFDVQGASATPQAFTWSVKGSSTQGISTAGSTPVIAPWIQSEPCTGDWNFGFYSLLINMISLKLRKKGFVQFYCFAGLTRYNNI